MTLFSVTFLVLITTTTTLALEETVNAVPVKCGKVNFRCTMRVTFEDDCSQVSRVLPKCTPKKSKCTKGAQVSFDTVNGCRVTGTFKSTGRKQSVSEVNIAVGGGATTTTTPSPRPTAPLLTEKVIIVKVDCEKVTYSDCTMTVTYKEDCSRVSKLVPSCLPKRSKCRGVLLAFDTQKALCSVTGTYKNTGKKQTMINLHITNKTWSWSQWEAWSECNPYSPCATCATQSRHRHCINSPTASACDGDPTEAVPCATEGTKTSHFLFVKLEHQNNWSCAILLAPCAFPNKRTEKFLIFVICCFFRDTLSFRQFSTGGGRLV